MYAHMHLIFKKIGNLVKKLDKFTSLIDAELKSYKEGKKLNLKSYLKNFSILFKNIANIKESLYQYWSTFKYNNDYSCELSLMQATEELEHAKQILTKGTLDDFEEVLKKLSLYIFYTRFFIYNKFIENLSCWRESIGRCAFDLQAKGNSYSFGEKLKEKNWRGCLQSGLTKKVVISEPKSFAYKRIPQVMRHISRLIYFFLKHAKQEPVEIECMYWKNRNILFISANELKTTLHLYKIIKQKKCSLLDLLLQKNFHKILSKHDKKTVERAHSKMSNLDTKKSKRRSRLKQESIDNLNTIDAILLLLKNKLPKKLDVTSSVISSKTLNDNSIYILNASKSKIKSTFVHAELWFVYILQNKLHVLSGEEIWVYGKKRPCFTCYCQLKYILEKCLEYNIKLHFNPRSGKAWYGQSKFFTENCLQSAENILTNIFNYISESFDKKQRSNYDSDSDSDSDCEDNSKNILDVGS
ncbi:MAG: hypothetical protein PVG30_04010 [Gammaproteobacteria bacterium]|jgi:hypothetical protein